MSIEINIGYAFSFEIRGFLFNLDKNFLHLFYFIRFAVTEKMGWCRRLLLEVKGYYKKMSPFFSYFEDFIKKRPSFRILRTSPRNDPYRIFLPDAKYMYVHNRSFVRETGDRNKPTYIKLNLSTLWTSASVKHRYYFNHRPSFMVSAHSQT